MNREMVEELADFFKALGEPIRISLMMRLKQGERSVTELAASTGTTIANVSKHLALMHRAGLLGRRKEGNLVLYSIGNENVLDVCECICGDIRGRLEKRNLSVAGFDTAASEGSG